MVTLIIFEAVAAIIVVGLLLWWITYLIRCAMWYEEHEKYGMGDFNCGMGAMLLLVPTILISMFTTLGILDQITNEYDHIGDMETKKVLVWAKDKPDNVRNRLRDVLTDKVLTRNERSEVYQIDAHNEHIRLGDEIDHFKYVEE